MCHRRETSSGSISATGNPCWKPGTWWELVSPASSYHTGDTFLIDGGYGKIKGKTFRISNMGDETDATISELIAALDDTITAM